MNTPETPAPPPVSGPVFPAPGGRSGPVFPAPGGRSGPVFPAPGGRSGPGLLLVRHGLSEWNLTGRWQGWADIPLAPEGEAQVAEALAAVATLGLTAVVHSGMLRTERTAVLLAEGLGLGPVGIEPGLKEYDVGEWSGLTRLEIEQKWPGALDAWFQGLLRATPGGESRDGFSSRLIAAVRRVAAAHPGGTVLCVTHGGALRTLQRVLSTDGSQGLSGPAERDGQGLSGPAERDGQGLSGPAERDRQGPRIGNLSGRWVHVAAGDDAALTLGALVHLLPPAIETESPSA